MQYQSTLETQLKQGDHFEIGWPWRLFLLSAVTCVLAVVVYVGMRFAYIPYLDSQIKNVDASTNTLQEKVTEEIQGSIINFYSQLANIQSTLASLHHPSQLFILLEKTTHKLVYYDSVSLDASTGVLKLSGVALSSQALSEQFAQYHVTSAFSDFSVDAVRLDDKTKTFLFEVSFRLLDTP